MATHDPPTAREEAAEVVNRLVPWTISILAHAALLLLAVFIAWSANVPQPLEAPHHPTLSRTLDLPALEQSSVADPNPEPAPPGAMPLIAHGPEPVKPTIQRAKSLNPSPFDAPRTAQGPTPFDDMYVGPAQQFNAGIFNPNANARRVVFVIDASGSLIDTLPYVITELQRMIRELDPEQEFAILLYNDTGVHEAAPPGMKKADERVKARRSAWLNEGPVIPSGQANPTEAIRLGLSYKPQAIFLLSDDITGSGRHGIDQRRLLAAIEAANTANTVIHTIQYIYPDPLERYGLKPTLQFIAERTGGDYKFVDARELGLR